MTSPAAPTGTLAAALAQGHRLLAHRPRAALTQADEILAVLCRQPEALLLRAAAQEALGDADGAIATLHDLTETHPDRPAGWRRLAVLLREAGRAGDADEANAREIAASSRDPVLLDAARALGGHDLPRAEQLLRARLRDDADDLAALRMLAELAGRIGRNLEAEELLRRALDLAPAFAPARYNLAIVLHRQHRSAEAIAELDILLEADPDNPAYRNLSGAVHGGIGAYDQALREFEGALARRPNNPNLWMSYGHTLKTVGRQEDSIASYRRSIALRPGMGEAWWSLANLKTVRFAAEERAAMEEALSAGELRPDDRFHLHFALGKAFGDAEDWAASFRYYAEGNRLRRSLLSYDPDEVHEQVERARRLFTPAFLAERIGQGALAADPIFVLGMPRSGSTLVEQILASHPLVEGTRELNEVGALAHRLSARRLRSDPSRYPEVLADLDTGALRALGDEYLVRTRVHRKTGRPFFIDKMPNNWAHLGLIRLILPNAKIIDTRRDPVACCFSNFKQHFARGQAFSYALSDLARYYTDYLAMMDHFDEVLPGWTHRVSHEAMVDDTEGTVRRLLDHCGLPFDPACLRFWETDRPVQTASSEQVRRPINRDGVDQWRHYRPWLGELEAALAK